MKKLTIIATIGIVLATTFSCSKEESCSFSKSTFENKTYKASIVNVDSAGVNVTSRYQALFTADPCSGNTSTLKSDGTYTTTKASGCNSSNTSGIWSVYTLNGKNYFTSDGLTQEVTAYDCNSLTIKFTSGSLIITQKATKI